MTFIEFDRFLKSFVDFINLWMTLTDFYFKKLFVDIDTTLINYNKFIFLIKVNKIILFKKSTKIV